MDTRNRDGRNETLDMYLTLMKPATTGTALNSTRGVIAASYVVGQQVAAWADHAKRSQIPASKPVTELERHQSLIRYCENNKYETIAQEFNWTNPLPSEIKEIPKNETQTIFMAIAHNGNLTSNEKLALINQLGVSLGYRQFCADLLIVPFINDPNFNQLIFQSYVMALQNNQIEHLLEEGIWSKLVNSDVYENLKAQLFNCLQRFAGNELERLLKFTKIWLASCTTIEEVINASETLKNSSVKTPFQKHESLVMKIAKQAVLNLLIISMETEVVEKDVTVEALLAEHRNSKVSGGYGSTKSMLIYNAIITNNYLEAVRLYKLEDQALCKAWNEAITPSVDLHMAPRM